MKNYEEKEKKLDDALKKLISMTNTVSNMSHDLASLNDQKNQLKIEKEAIEQKYQELNKENYSLKKRLEEVNQDLHDRINENNKFNQRVDELNQETENLIDEIDKWET